MLFTMFQYIPIFEEEVHACKTLEKKSDTSSNENDSDDDSGDDDNDTDVFFDNSYSENFSLFFTTAKFNSHCENYLSLVSSINTPPPKI